MTDLIAQDDTKELISLPKYPYNAYFSRETHCGYGKRYHIILLRQDRWAGTTLCGCGPMDTAGPTEAPRKEICKTCLRRWKERDLR